MHKNFTDLYLSSTGSDNWSGRLPDPAPDGSDGPFLTLDGARRAVRSLRTDSKLKGDIRILIRSGNYIVRETVVFGLADSAGEGICNSYEAYPGEVPCFTTGVPVVGWRRVDTALQGLPDQAKGQIWEADIPDGVNWFGMLYDKGAPLTRSRGSGFTPTVSGHWEDQECWSKGSRSRLHFPPGAMRAYENIDDVEIVIRPWCLWTMNILPLKEVDEINCVATMAVEGSYFLTRERYNRFPAESVWVENIPEGMTEPGRWMVNTFKRLIYLWPKGDKPSDTITVPCLREIVKVEGKIEGDEPEDVPVRGLSFKGLHFAHGDRDRWTVTHKGVQHDWEMWDEGNALFRLRGAEHCKILNCDFGPSGGTGIRFDLHSQYNNVEGCHFHDLGSTGIFLGGYGAGNKDCNRKNNVINNRIHDCGQQFWHAAGILLHQSGENRIAHNLLYNLPYAGIVLAGIRPGFLRSQVRNAVNSGRSNFDRSYMPIKHNMRTQSLREISTHVRWDEVPVFDGMTFDQEMALSLPFIHSKRNMVEFNEIRDIMLVLDDGNGIYISDCGPYNIIRYNRIYSMTHAFGAAIRTDEYQRDTLIEGNIIHDCRGGLSVSRNNLAWNNVIAFIYSSARSGVNDAKAEGEVFTPIYYHLDRAAGFPDGVMCRNICYHVGESPILFSLENVSTECAVPHQIVDMNVIHWVGQPESTIQVLEELRQYGFDANSIADDPGFFDAAKRDFRLRSDSPARNFGICSLPQEKIGLIK